MTDRGDDATDRSSPEDVAEERLRAVVASIGGHARSVNLGRADRLGAALAAVAAGSFPETAREEAAETAHQLVGSAGTFGFPEASQLAGEVERYFREADLADQARLTDAQDQVRRLREQLASGPGHQPDDEPDPTS